MKKIILTLTVFICLTSVVTAQDYIKIDTTKSVINWKGSNLFKYNKHYGTVKFLNGQVIISKGLITGGNFKVDMNSIINTDGKYSEMLVSHLKNEDFFHVEKHPTAKLKIIEAIYKDDKTIVIKAVLTIKGVTNEIKFKSKLIAIGKKRELISKFIIDRTRWKINYESKGLFASIKDDIISDAIEFEVIVEWISDDNC